jgi:hypothetical protein
MLIKITIGMTRREAASRTRAVRLEVERLSAKERVDAASESGDVSFTAMLGWVMWSTVSESKREPEGESAVSGGE